MRRIEFKVCRKCNKMYSENYVHNEEDKDYNEEIKTSFFDGFDYISDGIDEGAEIGGTILGIPGAIVGGVLGAVIGGIKGVLDGIFS